MALRALETRTKHDEDGIVEAMLSGDRAAFLVDHAGHILRFNHAAERLFNRQSSQVMGRRCYDIVGGRDVFGNRYCQEACPVLQMTRRGETIHAFEFSAAVVPRSEQHVQVSVHRFEDEDGDVQLVHVFEPIDQATRLARAVERLATATNGRSPEPAAPVPGADEPPLTAREAEVLRLVSEGLQNKEIAHKMGISHATVRNHVHNILEKLGVHSKLEAVSLAFRRGWVASADRRRTGASS